MKSKIINKGVYEPASGVIEALELVITLLKRDFSLNSPLEPIFRAGVEILTLLGTLIDKELKDREIDKELSPKLGPDSRKFVSSETFFPSSKPNDKDAPLPISVPTNEIAPLWGKQLHRNLFDNSLSWIPDPLVDQRDEYLVNDPNTGNKEVLISSNPKYSKKRNPRINLLDPSKALKELWDMAETLIRMVTGRDWLAHANLYQAEAKPSSRRKPPEGKRLSDQQYWYQKRRRHSKIQREQKG